MSDYDQLNDEVTQALNDLQENHRDRVYLAILKHNPNPSEDDIDTVMALIDAYASVVVEEVSKCVNNFESHDIKIAVMQYIVDSVQTALNFKQKVHDYETGTTEDGGQN